MRTSLAKEVEGQVSIVTQLPDVLAQSRAFISDRSKVHGMVIYIHKWGGRGQREKSMGGNTGGCIGVCLQTNAEFGVKCVGWV